ncbi:DUF4136 domain-containing protein [Luminiphilus sp.]|nr:DUF4136 domain-containing protein [Luminiphilus sp.]
MQIDWPKGSASSQRMELNEVFMQIAKRVQTAISLIKLACVATVTLALSACSSMTVESDFNAGTDFSSYKTFAFISDKPLLTVYNAPISPLFEGRVMRAVQDDLSAKGYEFVDDRENADFVVSFSIGGRDELRVSNYPSQYRGPTTWTWGAPYYTEVDVTNYTEGTLAIDIFDVASRAPVWHGWAVKTLYSEDRRNPTPLINDAVEAILEDFPPQ